MILGGCFLMPSKCSQLILWQMDDNNPPNNRFDPDWMIYMKVMLDSNICIYLIKNRPAHLRSKFQQYQFGDIGISSITLSELMFGVERNANRTQALTALRQLIETLQVVDFDAQAAYAYAKIRNALEKKSLTIGPLDSLIAAHAISLDLVLVTNNEREFSRVPDLQVENWV